MRLCVTILGTWTDGKPYEITFPAEEGWRWPNVQDIRVERVFVDRREYTPA